MQLTLPGAYVFQEAVVKAIAVLAAHQEAKDGEALPPQNLFLLSPTEALAIVQYDPEKSAKKRLYGDSGTID